MQLTALRTIHEGWVAMKLLGRLSDFEITHLDCVADGICVGVQYCFCSRAARRVGTSQKSCAASHGGSATKKVTRAGFNSLVKSN